MSEATSFLLVLIALLRWCRLSGLAEAEGARPSPGLRSALQQQCRAWLDALHSRSMARLNGTLLLLQPLLLLYWPSSRLQARNVQCTAQWPCRFLPANVVRGKMKKAFPEDADST